MKFGHQDEPAECPLCKGLTVDSISEHLGFIRNAIAYRCSACGIVEVDGRTNQPRCVWPVVGTSDTGSPIHATFSSPVEG